MAKPILTLEEKFWRRVEKGSGDDCWIWTGGMNADGYGTLYVGKGVYRLAHRWGYAKYVGKIPHLACVLHRCDTRLCVRTEHLFLGDRQVNGSDMALKGRGHKSVRGLPYGAHPLYPGRSGYSRPFQARVRIADKLIHLGTYATAEEASAVAVAYRNEVHGKAVR